MSQVAVEELEERAASLGSIAGSVSGDNVRSVLGDLPAKIGELGGDAEAIEDLRISCTRTAEATETAASDGLSSAATELEAAWTGSAASSAVGAITKQRAALLQDSALFTRAAGVLSSLSTNLASAKEDHTAILDHVADLAARVADVPEDDEEALHEFAVATRRVATAAATLLTALAQENRAAAAELRSISLGGDDVVALTPDGRESLEDILNRYQVAASEYELVDFPPPELVDIINPILEKLGFSVPSSKWTQEELDLFLQLRPDEMYTWYRLQQEAYVVSEQQFGDPDNTTHNHVDAFRHAYWNARMTQEFGAEWSEAFATAHERKPENGRYPEAMDLYNNERGREIGTSNPNASPDQIASQVRQSVDQGDMVVISQDGRLAYSDQVGHGGTTTLDDYDESEVDRGGFVPDTDGVRPDRSGLNPWA
ncbi:WXG100 family type VII secretion target [Actinoalloteichus spitiensis]|uniref:WXG100 family type VII secretion target n=1 Tax=Actinoalloteichus spitiensis TaxID=252394 RepID=UPI000379BB91|nr:hypothetical protein [Actinoalloteichus spitiensis]